MTGNTIAWMIDGDEETYVLALHGDMALVVKGGTLGEVWQFRGNGGQQEAIDRLVRETQVIEWKHDGDVREPVQFDLSADAISEISIATGFMDWVSAPTLREELMMEVARPELTGVLTGMAPPDPDWVSVGYVEKGLTMWPTSTPPTHPAVGDIWIES